MKNILLVLLAISTLNIYSIIVHGYIPTPFENFIAVMLLSESIDKIEKSR